MKEIVSSSSIYELVLVSVLLVAFLIQLYYYIGIYLKVVTLKKKNDPSASSSLPVSVIICARNEDQNLQNFLASVLEQDYPEFEVVVVNDCSADDSEFTLELLAKKYSNLRVTTIKQDEKFSHNKKLALTVGIKAAKYEWLLMTDADCKPVNNRWLATMASNFSGNTEIVLGFGGFFEEKGFLNKLIRFDGLVIAMQYFGSALIGKPYMGVGRNLAYKKELFFKNKGFATHAHINSGDDDLFINEVATATNTSIEFRHDSHTKTNPRKSYGHWVSQKLRHTSTARNYRFTTKLMLGGEIISRVLFFGTAIALITMQYYPWIVGSIILLRWIVQLSVIKGVMNRLNEKKLLLLSLLYDFYSLVFYASLLVRNRFNPRRKSWR